MFEEILMNWATGELSGAPVQSGVKRLGQLRNVFADRKRLDAMDPETTVYSVQYWHPVEEGATGGLFWGCTTLEPGKVGDEYFMTHGHFHALRDRVEIYATLHGEGALILMDESRRTWMEPMRPGSVHYIRGGVAHRVANTRDAPLAFVACWPSDAGHNYDCILKHRFGARMSEMDGRPVGGPVDVTPCKEFRERVTDRSTKFQIRWPTAKRSPISPGLKAHAEDRHCFSLADSTVYFKLRRKLATDHRYFSFHHVFSAAALILTSSHPLKVRGKQKTGGSHLL